MNRRVRGPYARWCERAGVSAMAHLSLLDSMLLFIKLVFAILDRKQIIVTIPKFICLFI